jgi:hypothetical protein
MMRLVQLSVDYMILMCKIVKSLLTNLHLALKENVVKAVSRKALVVVEIAVAVATAAAVEIAAAVAVADITVTVVVMVAAVAATTDINILCYHTKKTLRFAGFFVCYKYSANFYN